MRRKIILISLLIVGTVRCGESNHELITETKKHIKTIQNAQTLEQIQQAQAAAQIPIQKLRKKGALSGDSFVDILEFEVQQARIRIGAPTPEEKPGRPLPPLPARQASPPPVPPAGPPSTATRAADKPVENIPSQKQQLLEQIRAKKVLKKAPVPAEAPAVAPKKNGNKRPASPMDEQLRAGVPLKKVGPPAPRQPKHELEKPMQLQMDDEGRKQILETLKRKEAERLKKLEGAEWEG